jgi:hypothetical protein
MRTRVSSAVLAVGLTLLGPMLGSTSEATQAGDSRTGRGLLRSCTEHAVFTADGFRDATSALEG